MDPITPNNLPVEPSDLSYQVMPTDGGRAPSPELQAILKPTPSPAPASTSGPKLTVPLAAPLKTTPAPAPMGMLPEESTPSFLRSKMVYLIVGAVVILALGILGYFLFGSKNNSTPVTQTPTSKLPKAWLQQYFSLNVDTNGNCTDQTICGDTVDSDKDGLSNYDEFKAGTNPGSADTDGDGLADGDEVNIYKTDPTLKFTDRRDVVAANNWTDGFQIKGGYDPLTPGLKFTDTRKQQIAADTVTFSLHEPTITTLQVTAANGIAQTVNASIINNGFLPLTINVNKGDTVVWTNNDAIAHTVTSDTVGAGPASGNIAPKGTYSFKFDTAGTFNYHCSIHPSMKGIVVVQ